MEKEYGISQADLERIVVQYVLKQGDTIDVERLRDGLKELIRLNNAALMEDIKNMIKKGE
ncbi:hypothetical protein [Tuberibacillus calidus]|jgi:peptidyl-tRNA hydrolase|uniref:hypothetical protein n=1 Tax=Tuberibacillus calidus TaxID=340097 RepID=UPI000408D4CE|nr:hypothetical protein [Tuberibacillus calidus]